MIEATDRGNVRAARGRKSLPERFPFPAVICFVLLALYMIVLTASGSPLNRDADDLIKLHELRTFLATGNIFDRTLPDILQPEPYVSHWPWIADLPYALVAWPLVPVLGFGAALSVASYAVPLLLLAPALWFYTRLVVAVGFNDILLPLFFAVSFAVAGFFEFAPNRIDYHNLQIMLFFAALVLALSRHRHAAFANGLVVASALAISFEFVIFHALVLGVYAFDFVFDKEGGATRLRNFGVGLLVGAPVLFVAIVPPSAYLSGQCDSYSAPYALSLALAGAAFIGLPTAARRCGRITRGLMLCGLAVASMAIVLKLYPQCAGGPYGEMSARLREVALAYIPQEKSLLSRPDFMLSGSLPQMALLFMGALAPAALCLFERRRDRPLVIVALASIVALVQTVVYFRYLRYLPFFSGIGFLVLLAALLPPGARAHMIKERLNGRGPWLAVWLAIPGLCLTAAIALYCLARPAPVQVSVFGMTGYCRSSFPAGLEWPKNSVVLSPPQLGAALVAQSSHPAVVAIPNHRAAHGIERADRFLDPGAGDPRAALEESGATHVLVCATRRSVNPVLRSRYFSAVALMDGQPPAWLAQCPTGARPALRIYSYVHADGAAAACPVWAPGSL